MIQTLADLGCVGLALLLATLLTAARTSIRAARQGSGLALTAIGWLWVSFAVFTGVGLLAGTPIDALLWLSVGLATTEAVWDPDLRHR